MTTRTTLADVAAAAGVSVSTASLAFSGAGPIAGATKARVMAAAEDLGYSGPSALGRSLRSGRSGIVGVVIGDQLRRSFRDPVSIQVLDGLVGCLGSQGLGVLLIPAGRDDALNPLLLSASMDVAVLLWGAHSEDPTLTALSRRGIPAILSEGPRTSGLPVIGIDDRGGTAMLVAHLQELGHQTFGCVTLPFDSARRCARVDESRMRELDWTPTSNRLAGLADGGVTPDVIIEASASLVESGREAGRLVLDVADPPTAVIAQSDLLAAGVLLAARELGLRVPQDVSVAGFDGLDLPWLAPDVLTTVSQPLAAKGEALGDAVRQQLAGQTPADVELPVSLRVGTTTGPPPA